MIKDESKQYVDWAGLRYYDKRIKEHVDSKFSDIEDYKQLRNDHEQLENLVQTTTEHVYSHLEDLESTSVRKTDLADAVKRLEDSIRDVNSGTLPEDIATKQYVQDMIAEAQLEVQPSEEFVTEEELASRGYVTEKFVTDAIGSIPEVDLDGYAKLEDIPDTSSFLTEVPEEYVTEQELTSKGYITEHQTLEAYALKADIPTKVSELENDTNFVTSNMLENLATTDEVQSVETRISEFEETVASNYITIENGVTQTQLNSKVEEAVTTYTERIIDDKIEEVITSGATVSSISYGEF